MACRWTLQWPLATLQRTNWVRTSQLQKLQSIGLRIPICEVSDITIDTSTNHRQTLVLCLSMVQTDTVLIAPIDPFHTSSIKSTDPDNMETIQLTCTIHKSRDRSSWWRTHNVLCFLDMFYCTVNRYWMLPWNPRGKQQNVSGHWQTTYPQFPHSKG